MSRVDAPRFNQRVQDVRASEYYDAVFDGPGDPTLNAVLTVFRGMMNYVDLIVTQGGHSGALEYTVFKIRFLTLYQIFGSLQVLRDERPNLTSRSVEFIDKITSTAVAQLIMERAAKPFRNTLMHYNLNSHVDMTSVDLSEPLFGLVPIYFSSYDTPSFVSDVDRCITETALAMEEWAGI
jgi:hypothetical protein